MSYKVKGTIKQKQAVSILAGGDLNLKQSMIKAGYSLKTAHNPIKLTESKGFKELCNEAGLTREMVIKALADDIKDKPRDRSKELAQACKVLGLNKADNEQKSIVYDIGNAEFAEIIRLYYPRVNALDKPS